MSNNPTTDQQPHMMMLTPQQAIVKMVLDSQNNVTKLINMQEQQQAYIGLLLSNSIDIGNSKGAESKNTTSEETADQPTENKPINNQSITEEHKNISNKTGSVK